MHAELKRLYLDGGISYTLTHFFALASTAEESGFTTGGKPLLMQHIAPVVAQALAQGRIQLTVADRKHLSADIVAAQFQGAQDQQHSDCLVISREFLATVDRRILEQKITSGELNAPAIVKKLYGLIEREVRWE